MYVSRVKPWEDFGLDPRLFSLRCKLRDVFQLLSPMFIKYPRNKIKALFVLLVHKVVEIILFSGLSVKHFRFVQPFSFCYVHTWTLFWRVIDLSRLFSV